jgi:hypothetical protein
MDKIKSLTDIYDRMLAEDLKRAHRMNEILNKAVARCPSDKGKDYIKIKRPIDYIRES